MDCEKCGFWECNGNCEPILCRNCKTKKEYTEFNNIDINNIWNVCKECEEIINNTFHYKCVKCGKPCMVVMLKLKEQPILCYSCTHNKHFHKIGEEE